MIDRSRLHGALDALLDALDEYRRVPAEEELVKLVDVALETKAKRALVRDGKLRVVKIGRELYTRRSYVEALVDQLPAVITGAAETADDLTTAARKRAARRAA